MRTFALAGNLFMNVWLLWSCPGNTRERCASFFHVTLPWELHLVALHICMCVYIYTPILKATPSADVVEQQVRRCHPSISFEIKCLLQLAFFLISPFCKLWVFSIALKPSYCFPSHLWYNITALTNKSVGNIGNYFVHWDVGQSHLKQVVLIDVE